MNKIICFLFGHKKTHYNCLENTNKMLFKDCLGNQILHLRICERCRTAFFELGDLKNV